MFDFIHHLGFVFAYFVAAPQNLDFGFQFQNDFFALVFAEAGFVEFVVDYKDTAQRVHHAAAFGFGGMRGEYRDIGQLIEQVLHLYGTHTLLFEFVERGIKRAHPQRFVAADGAITLLVLKIFLGNVDQAEINTEGANHLGKGFHIQ